MVNIEEMTEETPVQAMDVEIPPSEERLLDAEEIEKAAVNMTRPSVRLQLESLATKLRKESAALKRVEESRAKINSVTDKDAPSKTESATPLDAAPSTMPTTPAVPPQMPSNMYTPIDRFSFDAGSYGSAFVTLYVALPAVGSIPGENISCHFTPTTFDLIVKDLNGKSYRLYKDNLEKDIEPEKSKYTVKADKIVIKLAKAKSEYGSYDFWTSLTAKKKRTPGKKDDPTASIMELMKDMYDSGDAATKKMIGETMLKQRRGELGKSPGMEDLDMGM
jgi:calcyclin binding protein